MLEKMREIIGEQLHVDPATIELGDSFKEDLRADSLDLVELIMYLEDEYDIQIPVEDLAELDTVGSVVEYLKGRGVED